MKIKTNTFSTELKFKTFKFPDGQQFFELLEEDKFASGIQITQSLRNFEDLELLICAVKTLNNHGYKNISAYIPYFMGARSDRAFSESGLHYLKDVICPIVNSLNFNKVRVLDPHSDVLGALLKNFEKVSNFDLVKFACEKIDRENIILIAPDAGASKKIYDLSSLCELGLVKDIIVCSKHRDVKTGKITGTSIPSYNFSNEHLLVVDDICDGGATFIELGKLLIHHGIGNSLCVTHGIFSKGFSELSKYYNCIVSTNSYKDVAEENVFQMDVFN